MGEGDARGTQRSWGLGRAGGGWHGHRAYWLRIVCRQGRCLHPESWTWGRGQGGAGNSVCSLRMQQQHRGHAGELGGLQGVSVTQILTGTGLASLGAPPIVPQLWPSVLRHSLSGTRISQGTGMVGLLSLMSITTTVSVAEPMSGGVPRSIAVTTKLWAGRRVRCVPTHVRDMWVWYMESIVGQGSRFLHT